MTTNNRIIKYFKEKVSIKVVIAVVVFVLAFSIAAVYLNPDRFQDGYEEDAARESEILLDETGYPGCVTTGKSLVTVELESGSVEVIELILEQESTHLTLNLTQVPGFRVFSGYEGALESDLLKDRLNDQLKQIYLRDEAGHEYRYHEGNYSIEHTSISACATGASWSSKVYLELSPLLPGATPFKVLIPLPDNSEIEVILPQ